MRIKLLEKNIANQIAAGEVIERPASVIKELLENSLDAGASTIEIDIERSGMSLIRVRDDGVGIVQEDLLLAIAQHATSKIRQLNDLASINSLGFRGEALASISSVAELTIQSQNENAEQAWQLTSTGDVMAVAHPKGTSMEVRQLFAKVPVRRKFLKSARTEFSHLEEVVKRIALSAYNVAFHLSHNGKSVLRLLPLSSIEQCLKRIAKIFGRKFAEHAKAIDKTNLDLRLWGWILSAEYSRAHADQQYFFVNGRMVKDKILNHAVRSAYAEAYQQGRYPAYVLYLECDASTVDVNVHPTKHEVRFHQQRLVHDFVLSTLNERLSEQPSNRAIDYQSTKTETTQQAVCENTANYHLSSVLAQQKVDKVKVHCCLAQQWIVATTSEQLLVYHYPRAQRWLAQQDFMQQQTKAQRLLLPETVSMSVDNVEGLIADTEQWLHYGIELQQVGPDNILLRCLPASLIGANYSVLLSALVNCQSKEQVIHCLSTHVVIAEDATQDEMQKMIRRLRIHEHSLLQQQGILLSLESEQLLQMLS